LDTLYQAAGQHDRRGPLFAAAPAAVRNQHWVAIREATYLCDVGQYEQALEILRGNTFYMWEGKIEAQSLFIRTLHARADRRMQAGEHRAAIDDLKLAMEFPDNLGVGRPHAPNFVREYYKLGLCHQALGETSEAQAYFQKAVESPAEPWREDPQSRRKAREQLERKR
jgi:tetratricopeptide (TPR) repeat protein